MVSHVSILLFVAFELSVAVFEALHNRRKWLFKKPDQLLTSLKTVLISIINARACAAQHFMHNISSCYALLLTRCAILELSAYLCLTQYLHKVSLVPNREAVSVHNLSAARQKAWKSNIFPYQNGFKVRLVWVSHALCRYTMCILKVFKSARRYKFHLLNWSSCMSETPAIAKTIRTVEKVTELNLFQGFLWGKIECFVKQ